MIRVKHILLGLLSVAALASCNIKEELQPDHTVYRFRGTVEQPLMNASTKAFAEHDLDQKKYYIRWNADDRISVFEKDNYNREYRFAGRTGNPSGPFSTFDTAPSPAEAISIGEEYQYAVYPFSSSNALNPDGTLTVRIPSAQTPYDDAYGVGANLMMVARAEDGDFGFKHIAAYIGVTLTGAGERVSSISFRGNNNEKLAGPLSVGFNDSNDLVIDFDTADPDASDVITMEFQSPVVLGSEETVLWLTVPAVTLSKGYTLIVTDVDGSYSEKQTSKSLTLERKIFYPCLAEAPNTPAPLDEYSYAKASSITVGKEYIIVDVDDQRVFTGAKSGAYEAVTPVDGVITGETLTAYEFTVEQVGNNYYLKFNDGNYLVCDYGSSGDSNSGLRYVTTQSAVTYPYALTVDSGAFFFSTTQMTTTTSTNQVLYYKPAALGGTGPDRFKIGGTGSDYGVHLYQKGGKQDRGLQFEPGEVVCLQGSTPERPELLGIFSTLTWRSDNTAVATVDGSGNVTVVGPGTTTITAEAEEDARYKAGSASYTLTILDASTAVYAKASAITVGGTYLVVNVADNLVFKGAQDGSGQSVSPENGVIVDTKRTLSAYEFTVEKSGENYYLKFNDGKYLVCDYSNSGNTTSGIRYVNTQAEVKYPYSLTVNNEAFFFKTSRADNGDANQYLYYKTSGNNANIFKIGGSGSSIGVHLYMKGGKRDRSLQFEPESVTCLLGSTPEKPELSGVYTTLTWKSDNTAVATVDGNGNVTVKSAGMAVITATAAEDDDYIAGSASYTLTVLDPNSSTYTKVTSLAVGGTYLIVDATDDKRVFKGTQDGSYVSVSPVSGVITDIERTLEDYEFTVEQTGNNYYLKFNDGKYLVCDYSSSGNTTTGIRYVASQTNVDYPYSVTVNNGVFFFSTSKIDGGTTGQILYYKPSTATGSGVDKFKIGGTGSNYGVHLYLKGGGSGGNTPAKKTQTLAFSTPTITWNLGQNYAIGQNYPFPQTATGAETTVTYTSETPSVATINNNRITIVAAGSATIKASAAETDDFYGATATFTLNIAAPAPDGWVDKGTINLENKAVQAYLNAAEASYMDTNEKTTTVVSQFMNAAEYSSISRKDCPAPVNITWTNPASSNTVVTIYSDQSLSTSTMVLSPVKASANATSAEVFNLIPGRKYYYTVSENGTIWEKGYFNTTGRRRMLKISSTYGYGHANNCRDLGGMVTKDGTKRIKYGYLFRGSNMDRTTTEDEKSLLYNVLNIRLDADLRASSYYGGGSSGSEPDGSSNAYRPFDANTYSAMTYVQRSFNSMNDIKNSPDRVKDIVEAIMNTVIAGNGAYFHCYVGADRTGFFGLLIEGMLGISEKDCSIDYELTSFSKTGLRGRDGSGQDYYWTQGLALLRGQSGSTFEQKCTNYLISIDVNQSLINQFKNYILESNN